MIRHRLLVAVGLACAVGRTWEEQRVIFQFSPRGLQLIDYLEERFVIDNWRER